jgi:hypothetical protein
VPPCCLWHGCGRRCRIPGSASAPATDTTTADQDRSTPLFAPDEAQGFRARWSDSQIGFVDEPRRAVEQADSLVAETMKRLAEVFAEERSQLEQHWERGDDISTEDLRVAVQWYRSFFDRLPAV